MYSIEKYANPAYYNVLCYLAYDRWYLDILDCLFQNPSNDRSRTNPICSNTFSILLPIPPKWNNIMRNDPYMCILMHLCLPIRCQYYHPPRPPLLPGPPRANEHEDARQHPMSENPTAEGPRRYCPGHLPCSSPFEWQSSGIRVARRPARLPTWGAAHVWRGEPRIVWCARDLPDRTNSAHKWVPSSAWLMDTPSASNWSILDSPWIVQRAVAQGSTQPQSAIGGVQIMPLLLRQKRDTLAAWVDDVPSSKGSISGETNTKTAKSSASGFFEPHQQYKIAVMGPHAKSV